MTTTRRRLFATAAAAAIAACFLLALVAGGDAFAGPTAGEAKAPKPPKDAEKTPAEQPAETLRRAETKKVCMVNDQLFERDQIPVEVGGKTYYGCCAMCKERLAKDAAARTGVDPVTGKKVDKATAVIGARADGSVVYFESEETFAKYQQQE